MFTVSKNFSFCYGHRLMRDAGRCRHLHGHTATVTFVLGSDALDERGMVVHFDRLKETVGSWIREHLDHTLLLCREDPLATMLEKTGERFVALEQNPTAENIARLLFEKARSFDLPIVRVEVWESATAKASYEAP